MRFACALRKAALAAPLVLACGGPQRASAEPSRPLASVGSPAVLAAPRVPAAVGAANAERVKKRWEAAIGGFGRAVAMHRGLGRVAVSSGSPIRLYDFASGKPAGKLATCDDVVRGGLGFAGKKLVVVCGSGVRLYDARTLKRVEGPDVHESRITASALSWPRLAVGHYDGVVRIYGLDGSATIEIPVPGPPIDVKSLALAPDGQSVAVAWVQGSIWWWKTAEPTVHYRLVRHSNESDSVAFNGDGTLLVEEGEPSFTTVWSFGDKPAQKAKIRNGDWIKRVLFTRDSKWLIRGGSDGLELAEIDGPRRVALDTRGRVEDVALDEHGASVAAVDRDGRLTLWSP